MNSLHHLRAKRRKSEEEVRKELLFEEVYETHEKTRHRETYRRRETEEGETKRGSVAPRSHAFRSVMAVGSASDAFRPS